MCRQQTAARKFCYVPEISSYAASAVIEFCIRSVRNKVSERFFLEQVSCIATPHLRLTPTVVQFEARWPWFEVSQLVCAFRTGLRTFSPRQLWEWRGRGWYHVCHDQITRLCCVLARNVIQVFKSCPPEAFQASATTDETRFGPNAWIHQLKTISIYQTIYLRIPHQKANFRSSNFPSFVFPFVCAAKTLKVERHSLRGCEREKHCFLMIAPWALHVCRTRKRWIGSDILDYCCCFCCSMADTVTMDTKVFGINPVVAVQASVN